MRSKAKRAAVIDDCPLNRAFITDLLAEDRWYVDTYERSIDFSYAQREKSYDLLVVDYHLNIKEIGTDLVSKLRKKGNQTPVIFVSSEESAREECVSLINSVFLKKEHLSLLTGLSSFVLGTLSKMGPLEAIRL